MNRPRTIADLYAAKQENRKIVMVSCYDYTTASLADKAGVDTILVGDSAAQLILGYDSTLSAAMDFMVMITAAVRRGAPNTCVVADMPFLSYQISTSEALRNAGRFVTEAGAQIVKVEVTDAYVDVVRTLSNAGISVMAHIGLLPQSIGKSGRFKAQGTCADQAYDLVCTARNMVNAGADSILIEASACEVAEIITKSVPVPVISCGSGNACDGQVLVVHDILGLSDVQNKPKFVHHFGNLAEKTLSALGAYCNAVRKGVFPGDDHSYHMKPGEIEKLQSLIG